MTTDEDSGPIEAFDWPTRVTGRAWTSGPRPRLFGYDLQGDLARHYGFGEIVLTSLRGEVPSREQGAAFELVLAFLAPVSAAEAPAHVAIVARTIDVRWPALVGASTTVLAEQSAAAIASLEPWLAWLREPSGEPPAMARSQDEDERAAVRCFVEQLGPHASAIPALGHDLGLLPALLAVAHDCGVRDSERLVALLVLARLPGVVAEALRPAGRLWSYPMDTPHFEYQPPTPEPDDR